MNTIDQVFKDTNESRQFLLKVITDTLKPVLGNDGDKPYTKYWYINGKSLDEISLMAYESDILLGGIHQLCHVIEKHKDSSHKPFADVIIPVIPVFPIFKAHMSYIENTTDFLCILSQSVDISQSCVVLIGKLIISYLKMVLPTIHRTGIELLERNMCVSWMCGYTSVIDLVNSLSHISQNNLSALRTADYPNPYALYQDMLMLNAVDDAKSMIHYGITYYRILLLCGYVSKNNTSKVDQYFDDALSWINYNINSLTDEEIRRPELLRLVDSLQLCNHNV
jgi:hypothetical protein